MRIEFKGKNKIRLKKSIYIRKTTNKKVSKESIDENDMIHVPLRLHLKLYLLHPKINSFYSWLFLSFCCSFFFCCIYILLLLVVDDVVVQHVQCTYNVLCIVQFPVSQQPSNMFLFFRSFYHSLVISSPS